MSKANFSFDFGPISRTLGPKPDPSQIGFASLPIHEVSTALLGAQNKEEFVAWLWHDTFKALFTFVRDSSGGMAWQHYFIQGILNSQYLKMLTDNLAMKAGISADYIHAHQSSKHVKDKFYPAAANMLPENEFVKSEFDQIQLGEKARFVQLSLRCQPAANTLLLRLALMEAFLQALSQTVAQGISGLGLKFDQVRYVFRHEDQPLNEDAIAAKYDLQVQDSCLTILHFVPSTKFEETEVAFDLTDAPPDKANPQKFGLSEMLTVYRDDLTMIATLPLFILNPDDAVANIQNRMKTLLPDVLNQLGIQPTHKAVTTDDLATVIFDEQIEVRLIADSFNEPRSKKDQPKGKLLHKLVTRPYELMADPLLISRCMICGSPIIGGVGRYLKGGKKVLADVFSDRFTDFEHVSFERDVCPMCLIYANSANRQVFRGVMAILSPSTSLRAPFGHELIEQPRFDRAGRFDFSAAKMLKAIVTLQELILLTAVSRRLLADLIPFKHVAAHGPREITDMVMPKPVKGEKDKTEEQVVGRYLPYMGAYFLFDIAAVNFLYRTAFLGRERVDGSTCDIWQSVNVVAYPFELALSPSFTMLLELRVNADFMNHAGAHTLLKISPTTVYLSPDFSFHVLVDNAVQETINHEYVAAMRMLDNLGSLLGMSKYDFTNALLMGDDPITAAYEATERPKQQGKKTPVDFETLKVREAQQMSKEVMGSGSIEEMWSNYVKRTEQIGKASDAHPTLIQFVPKPKKKGS